MFPLLLLLAVALLDVSAPMHTLKPVDDEASLLLPFRVAVGLGEGVDEPAVPLPLLEEVDDEGGAVVVVIGVAVVTVGVVVVDPSVDPALSDVDALALADDEQLSLKSNKLAL